MKSWPTVVTFATQMGQNLTQGGWLMQGLGYGMDLRINATRDYRTVDRKTDH